MGRAVHVSTLGEMIHARRDDVLGSRIRANAQLQCVAEPDFGFRPPLLAKATDSDHHRWLSATEELVATIQALQGRAEQISAHLRPPLRRSALSRQWWHIRYARRNRTLRDNYEAEADELCAQFDRALAVYKERAGDLPGFLVEYNTQQRQRAEQEWKRQKEEADREEARARTRRATALEAAAGPQWAYYLNDYRGSRSFWIYLSSLDDPRGDNSGLTVTEVHAALVAERAQHPHTWVMWGTETKRALEEKYQSESAGWEALTGESIDPHPVDPNGRGRSSGYRGPSTTYGGETGGGYSGDTGGSYSGCGGGFR